jgi:hypothetical protein
MVRTYSIPADAIANTPYILGTADNRVLAGKGQVFMYVVKVLKMVNVMAYSVKVNLIS